MTTCELLDYYWDDTDLVIETKELGIVRLKNAYLAALYMPFTNNMILPEDLQKMIIVGKDCDPILMNCH